MKINKTVFRAGALLLSILTIISPVLATNLETGSITHFGLPNVFDYDPYNITFITSVSGYIVVDQTEFLNAVVQGFMSNMAWEKYVNFTPYSVQHCEVNYRYYRCITAPRFDFTIDTSFGNYVSINGFSYQTGQQYTFPNSTSDLYFDRSISMQGQQTTASGHSTKTAYAYGIYNNPSIRLMLCDDSDNSINEITDYLSSIRDNVYYISTNYAGAVTLLSNLYTAVSSISSDVVTIKTYLNNINSNVSSIASTCSDILTQAQVNGQLLEDINDFLIYHFPVIENDLVSINNSINSFRSDFNIFALSCISHLNSIDSTTQSIDSSLDELLDLTKGTALQNVPVSSGGSTFSLWSIIKNSVSLGLGATGNFFSGLFDLLGIFGQYSNGFSSFTNISAYAPVSYIPEDLSISNQNLIGDSTFSKWNTNYKINIIRNGTSIRCNVMSGAPNSYTFTIEENLHLEPGNYLLYAPSIQGVSIVLRYNNSNYGSYVTDTNYPFSVSSSRNFSINLIINGTYAPFDRTFNLKVVNTG